MSIEKGELTSSLRSQPELTDGERLIWDAFVAVSSSRSKKLHTGSDRVNIVPEAVTVGEIAAILDFYGVCELEQRCRILRILQAMDRAYIEAKLEKVK